MTVNEREEMVTVQQVLASDPGSPPPAPFLESSPKSFGVEELPIGRYTSREFLALEYERLWSRVWQWAACEEDIPNIGDHTIYDIGDRSILIVRSGPDEFKAFNNSCLHRGRQLKDGPGSSRSLNCAFHGWTWNLDGTLAEIPCRWDFPQITNDADLRLPEVLLERWAGNIFINPDPHAGPLSDHLDVIPEHFKFFPLQEKFTVARVSKIMAANWKVVMEAFIEAYHVARTHPSIVAFIGDANTQYDIWDTSNRMHSLMGSPSPHLGAVDDETVYEAARRYYSGPLLDIGPATLPAGQTARQALSGLVQEAMLASTGVDISAASPSEIVDAVEYWVFPNWSPWASITNGLQYRWRPNGNDPDTSIMDVRLMYPLPPGAERPPVPEVRYLGVDEPFASVAELVGAGPLLDDDVKNMAAIQKGLKGATRKGLILGEYQESRIRHFHALLDECLGS